MTPPPAGHVLILTASVGGGHISAAEALRGAFAAAGGPAVEVLDVLALTNPVFRSVYRGGYYALERYLPAALGWLYAASDRLEQRGLVRRAIQRAAAGRLLRSLQRRPPALIVHTHFLGAELVGELIRTGRLDCRQLTVVTDFEVHRLWVQPPTAAYCVACPRAVAHLRASGVSDAACHLTGIPIMPAFAAPLPPVAARRRLELTGNRRLVLLLCGGFPAAYSLRLLGELDVLADELDVAVVSGRNEAIRARLAHAAQRRRHVHFVGFTDRMHDWMRAADVIVTKPGGLTSAEALACGTPLVLLRPIPGQEQRNSDVLLEHGAALKVNHPRVLAATVRALLTDPTRAAGLRRAAGALARPRAAADVVSIALRLLAGDPVPAADQPAAPIASRRL